MQKSDDRGDATLTWHKDVGVGPFKFGAELQTCAWALEGPPTPVSLELSEVSYRVRGKHDTYVYFENAKISSISSHAEFVIGSANIIGATLAQAVLAIGQEPDETEAQEVFDDAQRILYFYELGLTVWVYDGTIVSVQATLAF